jgi:hypothetical protein
MDYTPDLHYRAIQYGLIPIGKVQDKSGKTLYMYGDDGADIDPDDIELIRACHIGLKRSALIGASRK